MHGFSKGHVSVIIFKVELEVFQIVVSHELFQDLWVIVVINHQMACQKESSHNSRWNGFLWISWDIMTNYERKRVIKGYYGIFDIFQMLMVLDLQKVHMLHKLVV